MIWEKKEPIKEGWYFWKRAINITNQCFWHVYFIQNNNGFLSLWRAGTEIEWFNGGWWAGPISEQIVR